MKKVVAMIMLVVLMVGSAFADGLYSEVESVIPEEENPWFRIVFTISGDPEIEEAPDPMKRYTIVAYVMKDDSCYGKPSYLGIYDGDKVIDVASGYLIREVTKETAEDTIQAIKDMTFELPDVCFLYEEILK